MKDCVYILDNVINGFWQIRLPISQEVRELLAENCLVRSNEAIAHTSTISDQEMYLLFRIFVI